jgi:hypothetical protein
VDIEALQATACPFALTLDPGPSAALETACTVPGSREATDVNLTRNETGSVTETVVTFLLPVGAPTTVDAPAPRHCPQ